MKKFKVGDWVFSDFRLHQVKGVEGGRVTEISDGHFCRCSLSLTCFPLTLRNKCIADSVTYYYEQLHRCEGERLLNWPDIHRHFQAAFDEACSLPVVKIPEGKKDEALHSILCGLQDFVNKTKELLESTQENRVEGVSILRR